MSTAIQTVEELANQEYKYGFVTDVETDAIPVGLNEGVVELISAKKGEPKWLLDWRVNAFRVWSKMTEPVWHNVRYPPPVDYQAISYYAAPKKQQQLDSLDEVDPEIRATFDKLGISLDEQKRLSGVAVDAVFDSVSVATTFKGTLANLGIIFCSFSEAVRDHPELVRRYLGSVVAAYRQLLRRPQLRRVQRRVVRVHPQGREVPDGALDLFPHQRRQHPASSSGPCSWPTRARR